jgi:hypothetical protein
MSNFFALSDSNHEFVCPPHFSVAVEDMQNDGMQHDALLEDDACMELDQPDSVTIAAAAAAAAALLPPPPLCPFGVPRVSFGNGRQIEAFVDFSPNADAEEDATIKMGSSPRGVAADCDLSSLPLMASTAAGRGFGRELQASRQAGDGDARACRVEEDERRFENCDEDDHSSFLHLSSCQPSLERPALLLLLLLLQRLQLLA